MSGKHPTIQAFEAEQITRIAAEKDVPKFRAGDTLKVHYRIEDGQTSRIQMFEGLCIARRNRDYDSAFTVRKISNGVGVERVFPIYSPLVEKIEVVRRGVVRRAKLYYMRELTGKAARIREMTDYANIGKSKKARAAAAAAEEKKTAGE